MIARLLAALGQRWTRFWFEPAAASDLGLCRLFFFSGLLAFYLPEDFSGWGRVADALWMPIWIFEKAGIPRLGEKGLWILQWCWKAALLTSAIGLFTRASVLVSFAAGAYLLALPHNFGHVYHFDALLVFVLGALAVSRVGDAWSIDTLRKRDSGDRPPLSGEYTWPIRLVWVLMALVFLGAGLSKLRHGGIEWVLSDTMRTFLVRAHYGVSDADPLVSWGLTLAQRPWAPRLLAAATIFVEVLFVLSVVSARARLFFVPAAFGMLIGIRTLLGPTFGGFLIANVFWVPWTTVGEQVRAWFSSKKQVTAMSDSGCPPTPLEAEAAASLHPGRRTAATRETSKVRA